MPASTAPRLLDGEVRDALERARGLPIDELIELIERSGLRGRGGAGYPFADKVRAVRANLDGGPVCLVANGYDADPGSPLARTLLTKNASSVINGIAIAAHLVNATRAYLYLHPEAVDARAAAEHGITERADTNGVPIEIALGPGGFMGGEESALLNVLEARRAMARQRPPYPAAQGLQMRPTLVASVETLSWLPLIVAEQVRASTKLVSVTGAVQRPGVYEVTLGTSLGEILGEAGGAKGKLKGLHVGGPTGGILAASRTDTRFDFDDLRVAGTHMGSAHVRAIPAGTCIVNEAAALFAYLARESCAICVPCRVGTKRVQGILESAYSGLGRDSDLAWLDELGTHMERFSLCGFGITAPSILRTTMREFADDYRVHIQERRCPEDVCKPVRSRRYETMVQP
ncbi:MAG TPA: NADH-ubiquinone oxidoreductase-F iron-sulfur binding region domain-containing protein [Candidatus Limnocylindria bacterium]|nr:NADH-ubiquinone oxidoreductase-F iron-sulfur binding region domain-containing protein [Candidatus Limnocylindria bacterium]